MPAETKPITVTFDGKDRAGRPMTVKIHWYHDTEEWICETTIDGKRREAADYFTNDKDDALTTARDMVGLAPARGEG